MKLPSAAYTARETVRRWVCGGFAGAERRRADRGYSRRARAEQQLGGSEAGGERPAVNSRGKALRPNVRNVDRVSIEWLFWQQQQCQVLLILSHSTGVVEGGQHELGFLQS